MFRENATFLGRRLGRQDCVCSHGSDMLRLMLFYSGFLASGSKEEGNKKQNPFREKITHGSVPLPCVS